MKNLLFLLGTLFLLQIACNNDEGNCSTVEFSPNGYKFYFPYEIGDKILFTGENEKTDTAIIEDYQLDDTTYGPEDCFQESESFLGEVLLVYDSINSCNILFFSNLERELPFISAISSDCSFEATFQPINNGNAVINKLNNFTFQGSSYSEVLEINIENLNLGLEEIVIAKNHGFLYIKVNGETRIVL